MTTAGGSGFAGGGGFAGAGSNCRGTLWHILHAGHAKVLIQSNGLPIDSDASARIMLPHVRHCHS